MTLWRKLREKNGNDEEIKVQERKRDGQKDWHTGKIEESSPYVKQSMKC